MSTDDFGKRIQKAREAARMSREQLARKVGTSSSTVALWELGARPPPGDVSLVVLARALREDVAAFVADALATREHARIDIGAADVRALVAALLVELATADGKRIRALTAMVANTGAPR